MLSNCALCSAGLADILALDDLTVLVRTSDGLALALSRWRDLSPPERAAIAEAVSSAQRRLECGPAPARVALVETGPHVHLRIALGPAPTAETGSARFSAAPHDGALIPGGDDGLHRHLVPLIDRAVAVDALIAFVLRSGARLIAPHLQDLLERGGRLRLRTGDYLDATDPDALRLLSDLDGDVGLRVFEASARSFHPKSWIFDFADGAGALVVGSSNLSAPALVTGVEWNLRLFGDRAASPLAAARAAFEALFAAPETTPLTPAWIDAYSARRARPDRPSPLEAGVSDEPADAAPEPHEVQREALAALERSRRNGDRAGLVVLATGLGKTFLAVFDSRPYARVLFIAHRDEILTQAMAAFRRVRPAARLGRFNAAQKDEEADILSGLNRSSQQRHLGLRSGRRPAPRPGFANRASASVCR